MSEVRTPALDVAVRMEVPCELLCIYKRIHAYNLKQATISLCSISSFLQRRRLDHSNCFRNACELKFLEADNSVLFHGPESLLKSICNHTSVG